MKEYKELKHPDIWQLGSLLELFVLLGLGNCQNGKFDTFMQTDACYIKQDIVDSREFISQINSHNFMQLNSFFQ